MDIKEMQKRSPWGGHDHRGAVAAALGCGVRGEPLSASEHFTAALAVANSKPALDEQSKLVCRQRAAKIAAELPDNKDGALFILAEAARIHALIRGEAVDGETKLD